MYLSFRFYLFVTFACSIFRCHSEHPDLDMWWMWRAHVAGPSSAGIWGRVIFPKPNQLTQSLPLSQEKKLASCDPPFFCVFSVRHSSSFSYNCLISRSFFGSLVLRHQFLAKATLSEEGTDIETSIKDGTAIIFPGKDKKGSFLVTINRAWHLPVEQKQDFDFGWSMCATSLSNTERLLQELDD